MEANVYFFAALVSTGIFLLQFILSIFFGSMDTDIDVNVPNQPTGLLLCSVCRM